MDTFTMRAPDDFHCHLRDKRLLSDLLPEVTKSFARVLAMPNLNPPIFTGKDANNYRRKILDLHTLSAEPSSFEVIPSIQITENTTYSTIKEADQWGVRVGKIYPRNMTTNSESGVQNYQRLLPVLRNMELRGMSIIPAWTNLSHFVPSLGRGFMVCL